MNYLACLHCGRFAAFFAGGATTGSHSTCWIKRDQIKPDRIKPDQIKPELIGAMVAKANAEHQSTSAIEVHLLRP